MDYTRYPIQKQEDNMSEIISVKNLSKSYGSQKVLSDVSFSFESGQIIGLLGPNGSGKTSLIKILTGLINDYSGEVLINGNKPGKISKADVAFLPEKTYLASWMTADDAVNYIADFYDDFDKAKAMHMLDVFQLPHKQKAKTMSKGMQEKLQLILVMCRNAKLYILDEPMGGVDPATRASILNFIMENYAEKSTLLISTHLINDLESAFTHALFLGNGRILADAPVSVLTQGGQRHIEDVFKEVFFNVW